MHIMRLLHSLTPLSLSFANLALGLIVTEVDRFSLFLLSFPASRHNVSEMAAKSVQALFDRASKKGPD